MYTFLETLASREKATDLEFKSFFQHCPLVSYVPFVSQKLRNCAVQEFAMLLHWEEEYPKMCEI